MATRIGIRELRNRTSDVVRIAAEEGEVIITEHGTPVAVLRPYEDGWREEATRLLDESVDGSSDTGLSALLADDDIASMSDL